uniref:S-methyl-5-thioribose-1-phosphate isomerase n=1 Tax=Bursaphelenchus xylophilus TaxID=6326 RepID=A0A1I7SIQ2_BURXY
MATEFDGFTFEAVNFDKNKHDWADMSKIELKFATLKYDPAKKTLQVLDQLKLPTEQSYIDVNNVQDAFSVIRNMNVRGAPLIATVALLGLAVDLEHNPESKRKPVLEYIRESCEYLKTSRPTAVNLTNEILRLFEFLGQIKGESEEEIRKKVQDRSFAHYQAEREENDLLLRESTICVEHNVPAGVDKLNVITICNTGALATSSFGTALGP